MVDETTALLNVDETSVDENLKRKRFKLNKSLTFKYNFDQLTSDGKKKKLSMGQKVCIYIAIFVVITALSAYALLNDNFTDTLNAIKNATVWPILIILLLVTCSILLYGFVWTILSRFYKKDYKYYQGIFNGLIGNLFANVTPSSSGGQFAQAYTFNTQGIKVGKSASILLMEFIVFQIVAVLFGIICFGIGYKEIVTNIKSIDFFGIKFSPIWLTAIGFAITVGVVFLQFGLAFFKPLHRFVLNYGIDFLHKIGIVKNPMLKRKQLMIQVATFRIELKRLMTNWKAMLFLFCALFIEKIMMNSVSYFAGLASTNMGALAPHPSYLEALSLSGYLNLLTGLFITPGSSGAAELGFYQIYINFFGGHTATGIAVCNAANFISRGCTFYVRTILGLIVFLSYHSRTNKRYEFKLDSRTKVIYDLEVEAIRNDPSIYASYSLFVDSMKKKKKEKVPLLTVDEIQKSFDVINKNLLSNSETGSEDFSNDELSILSKQTLEETYNEVLSLNGEISNDIELNDELKQDSSFYHKYVTNKNRKREEKLNAKRIKKEMKNVKKLNTLQQEPTEITYDKQSGLNITNLAKGADFNPEDDEKKEN